MNEPVPASASSDRLTAPPLRHHLLVAILADPGAVDRLLTAWHGAGVRGATILDGRGMAEHLRGQVSLFAGLKAAFAPVGHSQVMIALVPAARSAALLAIAAEAGELATPGTGIAFAIEVAGAVGVAAREAGITGGGDQT